MKSKRFRFTSVSTLAGGLLLILAFLRGSAAQIGTILFAAAWCMAKFLPQLWQYGSAKFKQWRNTAHAEQTLAEQEGTPDLAPLLLQHVEARITELLHAVYPNAEWRWCEEDPEEIIVAGGTAWLRTRNTGAYGTAMVSFNTPADLQLEMVQTAPLSKAATPVAQTQSVSESAQPSSADEVEIYTPPSAVAETPAESPQEETTDVTLWYHLIGNPVLTKLITELNIRGCHHIEIDEAGTITAPNDVGKLCETATLERMPRMECWDELSKLLQEDELEANIENDRLVVGW